MFASSPSDSRARRPIDWIRSFVALTALVVFAVLAHLGGDLDAGLSDVLVEFPPFLDVLWTIVFWFGLAWAITLLCFAAFGRRPLLALELIAAGVLAVGLCAVVVGVGDRRGEPRLHRHGRHRRSADLPTCCARHHECRDQHRRAVSDVALPALRTHVGRRSDRRRPLPRHHRRIRRDRLAGRWCFGGRRPAPHLRIAWRDPDGRARRRRAPTTRPRGRGPELTCSCGATVSPCSTGTTAVGPVVVKVYGRDAWDGELLASMWLHLWYRDNKQSTRLKRSELVEHEGFMTFLASRAGARVPEVVTAGRSRTGDALDRLATRRELRSTATSTLTAAEIDSLWEQLAILHAAGIAHHRIDLERIDRLADGTAAFGDLSSASVQADETDLLRDRAQLFGLATLTSGEEAAVASARSALGDPDLVDLLPYLQEAAMPPGVHSALNKQDVELDDVRKRLTDTLGAPKADLVKLRRVTWGSVLNMALLIVAAYTIIGMLGGIDFEEFWDALQSANWWWLSLRPVHRPDASRRRRLQHDRVDDASAAARADDRAPVRDVLHQPHRPELRRPRRA